MLGRVLANLFRVFNRRDFSLVWKKSCLNWIAFIVCEIFFLYFLTPQLVRYCFSYPDV